LPFTAALPLDFCVETGVAVVGVALDCAGGDGAVGDGVAALFFCADAGMAGCDFGVAVGEGVITVADGVGVGEVATWPFDCLAVDELAAWAPFCPALPFDVVVVTVLDGVATSAAESP
jgi:hypothetical protein